MSWRRSARSGTGTEVYLKTAILGRLNERLRAEGAAVPRAIRTGLGAAARGARRDLLKGVRGSGRVSKKDRAIGVVVPRVRRGREPLARTFSRLVYKGGLAAGQPRAEPIDLLAVLDAAPTIRPAVNTWLAVPTNAAPRKSTGGRSRPATPSEAEYDHGVEMTFRLLSKDRALLTGKGRHSKTVYYVLIRQTKVRKKVDVAGTVRKWEARLPGLISVPLDRAERRIARRYAR